MRRAIAATGVTPDLVLVDGSVNRGFDIRSEAVIGGDCEKSVDRGGIDSCESNARPHHGGA